MTAITDHGNEWLRDYVTAGVSSSGAHEPLKSDGRAVIALIDIALGSLGVNGAITVKKATKALLEADLAHAADVLAVVYNDATSANNGIYIKSGASGTGSWPITALALPSSFAADLATVLAKTNTLDAAVAAADADRVAAEAARVLSQADAASAASSSDTAVTAADQSVAGAEAHGDFTAYDTKALADAAVAGLAEGTRVRIWQDETQTNHQTIYIKQSGALVFKTAILSAAALAATTGAGLIGTTSGLTAQAALDTVIGRLTPVTRVGFVPARYAAPTGMNNPLKVQVDCDGRTFAFSKRPYALTDWTQDPSITGKTDRYVDYDLGADTNLGTSAGAGNAWKTFDKAIAASPDKTTIHMMNARVGYLSSTAGGHTLGTRRIKIIGDHASGPTLFTGWRETYTAAYMAWVASGSAFTSTAAADLTTIKAMADDNFRDRWGMPLAMPHVASAATCLSTPGSWNFDGTTLTVHMLDARTPDPLNGWIPITSFSDMRFISDADIAFENISCAYHGGTGDITGLRFRPVTTGVANTIRVAAKNVRVFGGGCNAYQIFDAKTVALQECYGAYCGYDIFNYTSFITTGAQAQWMTVYEDNCYGHNAGYASWREAAPASSSNNLTTAHYGIHMWRVNPGGHNIPNSFLADVQGCFSFNFGVSPTQSTAGTLFQNNYWYQKLAGEGSTGAKMMLIGCYGDAVSADKYHLSNWNDTETAASLGEIHIADWQGPVTPKLRTGTLIYNYRTAAAL